MTTILLIRHGESAANRDDMFAGNYDAELMERGFEQARCSAKFIKENYKVDKVYASDLQRAYNTGKCVADAFGLEVEASAKFREIDAGEWDGVKFSEIYERWPEEFTVWMNDLPHGYCPGGETVHELGNRVFGEVGRVARENDGRTIVIATHATPVRVAYTMAKYGSVEKIEENPWPSNASVSVLYYDNGSWSCGDYSLDKHMGELCTYLPNDVE